MSSSTPSSSPTSSSTWSEPTQYRAVGVVLAIGSGILIGSSFVFKKKGLLSSQKGAVAGEGVAYLKSPMWWTGMTLMILGELCNFAAYAFVEAIIVTPMGALSVVISSLLSHFVLHEKLSLFGWISSLQCLLGAAILALNGPQEQSVSTIEGFKHLFVTPWFLAYGSVVIIAAAILALWVAPRWGKKTMMPYIGVCSLIGGLSVSCTQGLGTCIVTSIRGDNQFRNWFIYFLLVFVVITLLTEVYYLNVALAMFNTAMVTPTYYVTFTFFTLVTSIILYQGLTASASQIITVVLAFTVICTGIFILQMSKVDPRSLIKVDERTTLLLEAARAEVDPYAAQEIELRRSSTMRSRSSRIHTSSPGISPDAACVEEGDRDAEVAPLGVIDEKHALVARTEEPGLDALRGTFGALGTLVRARRRASVCSHSVVETVSVLSMDAARSVSYGSGSAWGRLGGGRRTGSALTARMGSETIPEAEHAADKEKGAREKGEVPEHIDAIALPLPARRHADRAASGSPAGVSRTNASSPSARFLSGELVASPATTPGSEQMRRGSIVRGDSVPERRSVHGSVAMESPTSTAAVEMRETG